MHTEARKRHHTFRLNFSLEKHRAFGGAGGTAGKKDDTFISCFTHDRNKGFILS